MSSASPSPSSANSSSLSNITTLSLSISLDPPPASQPPTSSPPKFEFELSSKHKANASHPELSPPDHPSKPPPPPTNHHLSPPAPPPSETVERPPPPPAISPPPPLNNTLLAPPDEPPERSPPPPENPHPPVPPTPPENSASPPPPPVSKPPQSSPPPSPPFPSPPLNSGGTTPSPPSYSPPYPPPNSSPPPPAVWISPRPAAILPPPSIIISLASNTRRSPPLEGRSPPPVISQDVVAPPDVPRANGSSNNETQPLRSSNGVSGGMVAILVILFFMFLGIFGTVVCCVWKRKKKISGYTGGYIMPPSLGSSQEADSALLKAPRLTPPFNVNISSKSFIYSPRMPGAYGNPKTWFSYEELVEATDGFSAKNLLGEGGFGSVYKGSLKEGGDVAVKQLNLGGGQGEREFRSEVEIISRIHHRHLVSLVGYCIYETRRLLVYDYVTNNNLYFHLHSEGRSALDWATRVKIAIGAARGIAYLHEDCHPRIIHRDIKSLNILLDKNFEARVSDFGLAKLALDANTHITTRVMGTFGYMAPEYASCGKLTEKSDVYSYGVVLLELITGRKPVDTSQPLGEESLVEWARPILIHALQTREISVLVDPRLEFRYVDSEMFRMIEAAAACVRHSSGKRPKMGQIARALDCDDMADLTNGMKVGESGMFNCAHESDEIRLFQRMAFGSQDYSTGFFVQDCWGMESDRISSRRRVVQ